MELKYPQWPKTFIKPDEDVACPKLELFITFNCVTHLSRFLKLFAILAILPTSSFTQDETQIGKSSETPVNIIASTYFSLGSYSTSTRSTSPSVFVTISDSWRHYHTLGYQSLWLSQDDLGGKYYTQNMISLRSAWQLSPWVGLSGHYAYLREGDITDFSSATIFHIAGASGSYWFSSEFMVGGASTIILEKSKHSGTSLAVVFSGHLTSGLWATTRLTISQSSWTPKLLGIRETFALPIGNGSSITSYLDFGRRVFYFDDLLLVVYNQRDVQTFGAGLKASICIFESWYLLPSVEYDVFDPYSVSYLSLGLRTIF